MDIMYEWEHIFGHPRVCHLQNKDKNWYFAALLLQLLFTKSLVHIYTVSIL